MPSNTDTRIVQMQFDNKDFERDVKTSEKTLERFKKSLDFSKCEDGLEAFGKASKNLSFDKFADNVQKLTDKFTGLGTVSELVLSQIRRGIESAARKVSGFIDSLGMQQVKAGLEKYESMNNSVQTIMAATGKSEAEVMKVMQRLNAYTDMTSYNFADMAANIGKFTSVGIPLEQAEKQMEGIANWAARSGANATEASRAMYNLSQAMGVGSLQSIDWKSIENAGMGTLEFKEQMIEAGIASGDLVVETTKDGKTIVKTNKKYGKQIEVNAQNFRETLSKKWATKEVLGSTLEVYYNADLYEAREPLVDMTEEQLNEVKRRYEDFKLDEKDYQYLKEQGLMNEEVKQAAIDAAVEQGKLIKVGEKDGKIVYKTAMKNAKNVEFTMDTMEKSLGTGWFDKAVGREVGYLNDLGQSSYEAAQKCKSLKDVIGAWKDQLSTGWMRVWQAIFGDLTESMEIFTAICNKVGDSFNGFIELLVGNTELGTKGIFGWWGNFGGRDSLWSLFIGEYDGLYEGAYGLLDVFKDIGKLVSNGFWLMVKNFVPGAQNVSDDDWLSNETYRTWFLGKKLAEATDKVREFIQGIKEWFNSVPEGMGKTRFQMLQDIVNGVFSAVQIVFTFVSKLFGFFGKLFGKGYLGDTIDLIISLFSSLGSSVQGAAKKTAKGKGITAFFDNLLTTIKPITDALNFLIRTIVEVVQSLLSSGKAGEKTTSFFQMIGNTIQKIASLIAKVAGPVIAFFGNFIKAVKDCFSGGINLESIKKFGSTIKDAFKKMFDSIFSFTPNLSDKIGGIWKDIKNVFKSGFSKESIEKLTGDFKSLFKSFREKIPGTVKDSATGIFTSVKTFVTDVWGKIKERFGSFFADFKNMFKSGFSSDSVEKVKGHFTSLFSSIGAKIPQGIKDTFSNITDKIKARFEAFKAKLKVFFGPLGDSIKNLFTNGFSAENFSKVKESFKKIFEKISGSFPDGMKEGASGIFDKIKTFFSTLWGNIKEAVMGFFGKGKTKHVVGSDPKGAGSSVVIETVVKPIEEGVEEASKGEGITAKIKEFLKKLWENIKKAILGFFGKGNNKNSKSGGKDILNDTVVQPMEESIEESSKRGGIFGIIKTFLQNSLDSFKEWLKGLFKGDSKGGIIETIKNFFGGIFKAGDKESTQKTPGFFDNIIQWFKDSFEKIKSFIQKLVGNNGEGGTFFADIKKALSGVDLSSILLIIIGALGIAGLFILVKKIMNSVQNIINVVDNVAAIPDKLKNMFGGGEEKKTTDAGDKMLKIAAAIAIIAAVMIFVGNMDLVKAAVGAGAIVLITIVLIVMLGQLKKLTKSLSNRDRKNMEVTINAILAIAGAFLMMAAVMVLLGSLPQDAFIRAMIGLVAIVASFWLMSKVIKKQKMGMKDMSGLLAMAGAIMMIVAGLMPLALIPWEGLKRMGAGLLGILLALFLFALGINKFASSGIKDTGMAQLAAVAAAVAILAGSLLPFAMLQWDQMARMGAALVFVLGALFLFVLGINKFASEGMSKTGMGQLAAVAAAVAILVTSLLPFAIIPWDQMAKMGAALGVILLLLLAFVVGVNKLAYDGMSKTGMGQLAAVAAAIAILAFAMIPLGLMKPEQLAKALIAVGILLLEVAAFVILVNNFAKEGIQKSGMVQLIAVGAVIILLVLCLIPLSMMPLPQLIQAVAAIFLIMLGLFLVLMAVSKLPNGKKAITNLLMFVALIAVIIVVAIALEKVKDIKLETIVAFIGMTVILMLGMALVLLILSKINNPVMMIIALIAMLVGLIAVLGILIVAIPLMMKAIASGIESLMSKLTVVSGLFVIFAQNMNEISESDLESAKKKFDVLISIVKGMAGVSSYYSDVRAFENMMLMLSNGLDMFDKATRDLGDPATNPGIGFIDALLERADQFRTFTIGNFDTEIAELGGGLALFSDGIAGKEDQVTRSINLLCYLAKQSGNLNALSEIDMDKLKTNLAGLGGALMIYAQGAQDAAGVADDEVPSVQKAVELIRQVMTSLSEEGGISSIPDLPEEDELTDFGVQLAALAGALMKFSEASKDLDDGNLTKAYDLLTFMMTLKEKLTADTIGVVGVMGKEGVTKTSLTKFGVQITTLGTALKNFGNNTADLPDMKKAEDALIFFANLKDRLTPSNAKSILSFKEAGIDSVDVLTTFAAQIGELGIGLSSFAENVNFDADKQASVEAAIKAMDQIVMISNRLPVIGGLKGLLSGNNQTIGDLADELGELGVGLANMSKALSGKEGEMKFDSELVTDAMYALLSFADVIDLMKSFDVQVNDADSFAWSAMVTAQRIAEFVYALNHAFSYTDDDQEGYEATTMVEGFAQMVRDFDEAMGDLGDIKNANAFAAFRNLAEGIANLVNVDPSLDFSRIGENMALGIVKGLNDQKAYVEGSIKALVAAAKVAAEEEAKIKSPSRVFAQIGSYMALGMVVGMKSEGREVEIAGETMAQNAIASAQGPLAALSSILSGEIDPNPTITPILDLSNISAGSQALNGMLGGALGLTANGGTLSIDPSRASFFAQTSLPKDYSAPIDGIKDEVNSLRGDLRTMTEAVRQMKFVFNSGAVVAAIGPEMDAYLARQGYYSARSEIP